MIPPFLFLPNSFPPAMLANWGLLEKEEGKGCRPTHMHFPYDIFLFAPLFLFLHKCISEHSSQSSEEYRRFLAHSSCRRWQQKKCNSIPQTRKALSFFDSSNLLSDISLVPKRCRICGFFLSIEIDLIVTSKLFFSFFNKFATFWGKSAWAAAKGGKGRNERWGETDKRKGRRWKFALAFFLCLSSGKSKVVRFF